MADVTFGVKVTPELKEKIEQLFKASDFDTQKEWFQNLLSIYDLHQLKHQDGTKRYASDLDYIEQNLTRIQETIVQMMKKTADDITHQEAEWIKASDELQQQLLQSEQLRKELESRITETEEQTIQHKKNLTELQKQSSLLDELCTTLKKSFIAEQIQKSAAVRAVGTAIGANPVLITVPCHRIIGKNGSLTDYRGGIDMKTKLSQLEQNGVLLGGGYSMPDRLAERYTAKQHIICKNK